VWTVWEKQLLPPSYCLLISEKIDSLAMLWCCVYTSHFDCFCYLSISK